MIRVEYTGTRAGRWLRQPIRVRRMLLVALVCLLAAFNDWLPHPVQGALFLAGAVLLVWHLVLDIGDARRHRKAEK